MIKRSTVNSRIYEKLSVVSTVLLIAFRPNAVNNNYLVRYFQLSLVHSISNSGPSVFDTENINFKFARYLHNLMVFQGMVCIGLLRNHEVVLRKRHQQASLPAHFNV